MTGPHDNDDAVSPDAVDFIVLRAAEPGGEVPTLYENRALPREMLVAPGQDVLRFHERQELLARPTDQVVDVDGTPAQVWLVEPDPAGYPDA